MISNRLTISPELSIRSFRNAAVQLKLPRDDGLREIAFADEIRHHVNFTNRFGIEQKQRVAQAGFFFPEAALHVRKNLASSDLGCMRQRRRARIRVDSRAVRNNQKPAVIGSHGRNLQQLAVSASPTATDELRRAIEQVIAIKKARAVWTLVAKVK
jgi:hypothetical protein